MLNCRMAEWGPVARVANELADSVEALRQWKGFRNARAWLNPQPSPPLSVVAINALELVVLDECHPKGSNRDRNSGCLG